MPAFANWVLAAIVLTAVVVAVAAAATIRRSAPLRRRYAVQADTNRDDMRALARRLAGPVADAFSSLALMGELADQGPGHRQAVVALLTEHLRERSGPGDPAVIRAVQSSLVGHLRMHTRGSRTGAPPELDLTGVRLRDLDLSDLRLAGLSLAHAQLTGTTRLSGLRCSGGVEATSLICDGDLIAPDLHAAAGLRLAHSVLGALDLRGAFVQGTTDLSGAHVAGSAWLTGAVLPAIRFHSGGPGAPAASFAGPADLQGLMCDEIQLYGTEFRGGLIVTINQDCGIGREVSHGDPELVSLVRQAVYYKLGEDGRV